MKTYKNIGLLDLRRATDEQLAQISRIEAIGTLIVGDSQMDALSRIRRTAIGTTIQIPSDAELILQNGECHINASRINGFKSKTFFIINGVAIFDETVTVEDLDKISRLMINGRLIMPESLLGALGAKVQINGDTVALKAGEQYKEDVFHLNDINLFGMANGSKLVVDQLQALEDFDHELFSEKITEIRVLEEVVTTHANLKIIAKSISNYLQAEKFVVPDGYAFYDSLTLDEMKLKTLNSRNLFIKGQLTIDTDSGLILEKISGIICDTIEINQSQYETLKPILVKVTNINWKDHGDTMNMTHLLISDYYLNQVDSVSFTNYGKLVFDTTVTRELFEAKVTRIENYGVVSCPQDLYAHVLKRVIKNFGKVKVHEEEAYSPDSEDENVISGLGFLEF
ncbi:MAG: hypothetical protein LCH34_09255 [Firmicutes bacterium]|nr:hypothetical protein [Bacillota bacterium]